MTQEQQTAQDAPAKYAIDEEAFEASGMSFAFAVKSRLGWEEQRALEEQGVAVGEAREHMKTIAEKSAGQPDYIMPGTPLTEAIFRLMLANQNRPMTVEEIRQGLSEAWASVLYMKDLSDELLTELMETPNAYHIRRVGQENS